MMISVSNLRIILIIFLVQAIYGLVFPTILYPIWVKYRYNHGKFTTSYSNTYKVFYPIEHMQHVFTAWALSHVYNLLPSITFYSIDSVWQLVLSLGSMIGLSIVGYCPTSINSEVTKVHCFGAQLCAIFAMLWLFTQGYTIPTVIFLLVGFIWSRLYQRRYETLIMEAFAFVAMYSGVILNTIRDLSNLMR